jgi:Gpi18-like mannosyltransferase
LIGGLVLRLLLAYVLLPNSGHRGDIFLYTDWAMTVARVGPNDFYDTVQFSDYPPAYLYVLWLVGQASEAIAGATNVHVELVTRSLVKIPAILFDVCAGFLLYRIARDWSADRANCERPALLAAALYLFNPATWYDSAIWGQTDAVGACLMLAGMLALMKGSAELAVLIAVVATLVKPQFGVILGPIVATVLLRRHVFAGESFAFSVRNTDWLGRHGPLRILSAVLVGTVTFYVLAAPFDLGLHSFLNRMAATANGYPMLSVNAYNPWALIRSGDTPALVGSPVGTWSRDDIPLLGPITGVMIGSTLLGLGFLVGIARLFWRADRRSIALVGAFLCLCFFVLPTRVHERYLIPVFAFACLLAAFDRKWLGAMLALSLAASMNLHGVLTTQYFGTENLLRLPLGQFCHSPPGMLISVTLHTIVFCFAAYCLHPKLFRPEPQPLIAPDSEDNPLSHIQARSKA